MSQVDYTNKAAALKLQEKLNSNLRIRAGARTRALSGCFNVQSRTNAQNSKSLHMGSLSMNKITGEMDDLNKSRITAGATYLRKEEFGEIIILPGSELRYAERDPSAMVGQRLAEADDYLVDRQMVHACYGDVLTGDSANPTRNSDVYVVEHDGTGLTPQKIVAASNAVRRYSPGAKICMGLSVDTYGHLTEFDVFTNNDFMVGGDASVYSGMIMQPPRFYQTMMKMIPDFVADDAKADTQVLKPVMKVERYLTAGTWDGESYVRHIPLWATDGIDFEEGYAPTTEVMSDYWKTHDKPKGTTGIRIDHEFGFAKNNAKKVAIIQVIEKIPGMTA